MLQACLSEAELPRGATALELGCGTVNEVMVWDEPSVVHLTAPSRSMRSGRAPAWVRLARASGCGWPKRLRMPHEILA